MATSITVDISDPQINVVHDRSPHGDQCQLVYIKTATEPTTLILHFSSPDALRAFVGLQTLAIGGINAEPNAPGA